jgi:hypothetical protein
MDETAFLAPHNYSTFSFKTIGDIYEPDDDLNVPPVTRWMRNGRSFVFVSRADPAVHFYEPESGKRWSVPLPPSSQPFDLVIWQNWLFVAAGGKSLLATAEWQAGTAWISLPCDKDIDALAIQQETLLAIDNIVCPKWLLRYELTSAGAREPSDRVTCPRHLRGNSSSRLLRQQICRPFADGQLRSRRQACLDLKLFDIRRIGPCLQH